MDVHVIGTQKAATSWIYRCLDEHPEVALPAHKYEVEYLGGNLSQIYGSHWYFEQIPADEDRIRGDVSVEYLFDPRSPGAVRRCAPDAKLVAILREPVARALSAYAWNRRSPVASANLPATAEATFRELLDEIIICIR